MIVINLEINISMHSFTQNFLKMNLSKLFTLCALMLLGSNAIFAQKCNFDTDKKDDFTGAHVRTVKHKLGNFFYKWWILMEQNGPKYFITVQSAGTGKIDDIIPKGSKILFKLDNDKVVEMPVSEDCVPSHTVQSNTIITTWLPKGEISKDAMQKMSESGIVLIRMNIGGKDFDSPSPSGKETEKMRQSAECLLKD